MNAEQKNAEHATDSVVEQPLASLLTPEQLAERLCVPSTWVREKTCEARLRDKDPLPVVRLGKYVLRFVTMTLLELKAALVGKRWSSGNHCVRELIERLEECGVVVEVNQLDNATRDG